MTTSREAEQANLKIAQTTELIRKSDRSSVGFGGEGENQEVEFRKILHPEKGIIVVAVDPNTPA